jgi:hypothetical protein
MTCLAATDLRDLSGGGEMKPVAEPDPSHKSAPQEHESGHPALDRTAEAELLRMHFVPGDDQRKQEERDQRGVEKEETVDRQAEEVEGVVVDHVEERRQPEQPGPFRGAVATTSMGTPATAVTKSLPWRAAVMQAMSR